MHYRVPQKKKANREKNFATKKKANRNATKKKGEWITLKGLAEKKSFLGPRSFGSGCIKVEHSAGDLFIVF